MGTVWRATQLSSNREVALKMLRGGCFGSSRARARFEREIELLAKLEHPHIARLYHSGVHQGLHFFAMELVEGLPLDEYVAKRRLDQKSILSLMATVCRAVDYAHRRGVIHRDLKPSNILVDANGEPRVLDFGLGKDLQRPDVAPLSIDGAVAGTPQYMSPEQALGDLTRIDTRSDVYSLGVLLYRLLTRRFPHDESLSLYRLQQAIIEDPPRRPRSISVEIDGELEAVLLKALAKEPEERYTAPRELADDLVAYGRGDPLRARKLTLSYFLRKRLSRHRLPVSLAAAAIAAAMGGATYSYLEIAAARDIAELNAEHAQEALYRGQLAAAELAEAGGNHAVAVATLERAAPERRGWEWQHLRRRLDNSSMTVALPRRAEWARLLHGDQALFVGYDGRSGAYLDIGGSDSERSFSLQDRDLTIVRVPAEERLLLARAGNDLVLLDTSNLEIVKRLKGGGQISELSVSADCDYVLGISPDGTLTRWRTSDDDVTHITGISGQLYGIAISKKGLVALVQGGSVRLVTPNGTSTDEVGRVSGSFPAEAIAFAPSGEHLVVSFRDGTAACYAVPSMDRVWQRPMSVEPYRVYVSRAGIAGFVSAFSIVQLRLADGSTARTLTSSEMIATVGYSGASVVATTSSGLRVWRGGTVGVEASSALAGAPVMGLTSAPDGRIAGRSGGNIVLWDGAQTPRFLDHRSALSTLYDVWGVSAGGDGSVTGFTSGGECITWSESAGWSRRSITTPLTGTGTARFSANGRALIVRQPTQQPLLFDLTKEHALVRRPALQWPIAFSPDGGMLVGRDPEVPHRAWLESLDGETRQPIEVRERVKSVTFSGDGNLVAIGAESGGVMVFAIATGDKVSDFAIGIKTPGIALNRDGSRLVAFSHHAPLIDTSSGERLLTLLPDDQQIWDATYRPDGAIVIATSRELHLLRAYPQ